ncbi:MAG: PhoH family protein, partial [Nitrospinota bacterium]
GSPLTVEGAKSRVGQVKNMLSQLNVLHDEGVVFRNNDLRFVFRLFAHNGNVDAVEIFSKKNQIVTDKAAIVPNSISQKEYSHAMAKYDMVFGIGPAGTGKTYLSVAMGISYLIQKKSFQNNSCPSSY